MDCDPHAVRWTLRKVGGEHQYTKWHWTDDAVVTVCGVIIRFGEIQIFPETDDDIERVDCKHCKRQMGL